MTDGVKKFLDRACDKLSAEGELCEMFRKCYLSTLETTVRLTGEDTFVITGDIPAMWLRDSSAQVEHYLCAAADDTELRGIIAGVIARQVKCILIDPYANAFNLTSDNRYKPDTDRTEMNGWLWERKYEVDSLCWPVRLAYNYLRTTGDQTPFNEDCHRAWWSIAETFAREQEHESSPYRFERDLAEVWGLETETLRHGGRGMPVNYTGMTWSGFRPSDDACTFGYLVPSNMFAVVSLRQISEVASLIWKDEHLSKFAAKLAGEIDYGLRKYATFLHPTHGRIWAYETDGFGNYTLMDDANVPSLLSAPYLGYCSSDDPIYQNTRSFILSGDNPYYYSGSAACGIGSPHTPKNYIWHISLALEGLTSTRETAREKAAMILATSAGTLAAHEGFDCSDPSSFTRPWFAWADSMFAAAVMYGWELE